MQAVANGQRNLSPFLKWAGGKRWLIPRVKSQLPDTYNRYIEPFLGGGSLFFGLDPQSALLSDINPELIDLYVAIRDFPHEIEQILRHHSALHNDDYYYQMRSEIPRGISARAARTLYLNRTCWNGLYRVNRKGLFNVPRGTKNNVILETDNFQGYSEKLRGALISCCDFENTISHAQEGDFIFADPPYTVKHNMNGFVKYNEIMFRWEDQVRLRNAALEAAARGAVVMISNADHPSIHELYDGIASIDRVPRHSVISGKASARVETSEVLISIGS